jgi:hypothetical protein
MFCAAQENTTDFGKGGKVSRKHYAKPAVKDTKMKIYSFQSHARFRFPPLAEFCPRSWTKVILK